MYLRIFIFIFICLSVISNAGIAFTFGGCEEDCTKCHKMTIGEASDILKRFDGSLKINEVRMAPSKGLWEVIFETNKKRGIAYIDFSKENLILGNILKINTKQNLTQERIVELNKVDVSTIPLDDALVMGNKKAEKRVIVFDDPD